MPTFFSSCGSYESLELKSPMLGPKKINADSLRFCAASLVLGGQPINGKIHDVVVGVDCFEV